jgi:hypothetical protein
MVAERLTEWASELDRDTLPLIYRSSAELLKTRPPFDGFPAYNMLHYGSGLKYFEER